MRVFGVNTIPSEVVLMRTCRVDFEFDLKYNKMMIIATAAMLIELITMIVV